MLQKVGGSMLLNLYDFKAQRREYLLFAISNWIRGHLKLFNFLWEQPTIIAQMITLWQ